MTYPSTVSSGSPTAGASYNYSYDSMFRLSGMTTSGGTTVVNNVSYNAANQLLTMTNPSGTETRSYDVLNQLVTLTAGSGLVADAPDLHISDGNQQRQDQFHVQRHQR
jgi:YD repeat-containing protein